MRLGSGPQNALGYQREEGWDGRDEEGVSVLIQGVYFLAAVKAKDYIYIRV